jgi:hypothetical protein
MSGMHTPVTTPQQEDLAVRAGQRGDQRGSGAQCPVSAHRWLRSREPVVAAGGGPGGRRIGGGATDAPLANGSATAETGRPTHPRTPHSEYRLPAAGSGQAIAHRRACSQLPHLTPQ